MVTEKTFAAGSEFPALQKGTLRHYSMRFCPFAQRVRLVLAYKKIPHETVNVSLNDRPDWFAPKSPQGKVPCIEINGKCLIESLIVAEYLDEAYEPKNVLFSKDPWKKAEQKILIEQSTEMTGPFYALLKGGEGVPEAKEKLANFLRKFEKNLKGDFFGGNRPDAVDYMIWPWYERFGALSQLRDFDFSATEFPLITAWWKRMAADEAVRATMLDDQTHMAFVQSFLGGKPNYDIGLE